jgi:hypothetical protein
VALRKITIDPFAATTMPSSQKYIPPSRKNQKDAANNQRMNLMPSISRSSGLDKGGDA